MQCTRAISMLTGPTLVGLVVGGCVCDLRDSDPPIEPGWCAPYEPKTDLLVDFDEVPRQPAEYDTGYVERHMSISATERGVPSSNGFWRTVYDYQSQWIIGRLRLDLPRPWVAQDLTGRQVTLSSLGWFAGCGAGGESPAVVTEDVLRDADGRLLLLAVRLPISADRSLEVDPGLVPELTLEWKEAGCAEHADASGRAAITVGIVVRPEDGDAVGVGVGQRLPVVLDGERYVAALAAAEKQRASDCGTVALSVYREDFLTQLAEPGVDAGSAGPAGPDAASPGPDARDAGAPDAGNAAAVADAGEPLDGG